MANPPTRPDNPLYYQQTTERLLRETERQRREIVTLRKDLAASLTQYVRAAIVVQNLERWESLSAAGHADDALGANLDLKISLDNWRSNRLGTPRDILARIDLLNQPIPEGQ